MFSRPGVIEFHGYCPSIRLDRILLLNESPTTSVSNTEPIFTGAPISGGNIYNYKHLTQQDPMNRCIIRTFYENPTRNFGSRNSIYTDSQSTCNNCILISDHNYSRGRDSHGSPFTNRYIKGSAGRSSPV